MSHPPAVERPPLPRSLGEAVLVGRDGADGRVLTIGLNRPQVRNAVDSAIARGVAGALDELDADPGLRVAVLHGVGGTFCSGMDLSAFLRGETLDEGGRGFGGIVTRPPRKPVIAAVEGHAVAGGWEIVLACDLVVAASDAVFGLPEVRRGLVAAGGGVFRLARLLPPAVVNHVVIAGATLGATRAHSLGLVSELAAPGTALAVALELARGVAALAPLAVDAGKQVVAAAPGWARGEEFAEQARIVEPVLASEDAQEGARAFLERREPRWSGM